MVGSMRGLELAIKASEKSKEKIKSGAAIRFGFNDDLYITGFNSDSKYSYDMIFDKCKSVDINLKNQTLYLTHEPHRRDALKIADKGIKRVVYIHDFNHRGRDVLRALGVEVLRIDLDSLC